MWQSAILAQNQNHNVGVYFNSPDLVQLQQNVAAIFIIIPEINAVFYKCELCE